MIRLFTFSLILISLSSAFAGDEVGNGADNADATANSAWFFSPLAREPKRTHFSYCYELSPGFEVQREVVEQTLQDVFQIWTDYIKQKFGNTDVGIITRGNLQTCTGSEDLKFYLGTLRPDLEIERRKYSNPSAFALRASYDLKQTWSKGYIWLAPNESVNPNNHFPNWSKPSVLTAILLHEMGHVFGCEHVPGTIMDAQLSELIGNDTLPAEALTKIDSTHELLMNSNESNYQGFIGKTLSPMREIIEDAFQVFVGRTSVGNVEAKLVIQPEGKQDLFIKDDLGTTVLHLQFTGRRTSFPIDLKVFKIANLEETANGDQVHIGFATPVSFVEYGSLKAFDGTEYPISEEVNTKLQIMGPEGLAIPSGPANLFYEKDGEVRLLFGSHP